MIRSIATRRPVRWLARPVYDAAVRIELEKERTRDEGRACVFDFDDTTALVKTFERPHVLARLLESLRRVYPKLPVLVVDDSARPTMEPRDGVEVLRLPYDVGLAEGRNRALERIRTPLFVLLDDDFVLTARSGLDRVVASMRAHPELDIVGGQVLTLPLYRRDVRRENRDYFGGDAARPSSVAGLPTYDRVANYFVGRTRRVAEIGWDPKLKLLEHTDFFRRAHGKLLVAFDESFSCLHAMTPFDAEYLARRSDVARYRAYLDLKWR